MYNISKFCYTNIVFKYTLPSYNYFWWDHYEFESGTAKVSVSGDQIVMVVDGVLSTGEPFYIHAKGPINK